MTPPTVRQLLDLQRTLVIAHRGNSSQAPENTLPAFRSAIAVGADLVELDYHHSADGVPVVIHDDDLDRTTDGPSVWNARKILVRSRSAKQLRQLDAGSWFGPEFAVTPLPTLDEALDTILPGCVPAIEHKAGDAATCINLLRRKGAIDRVVLQSFDWKFLAECHRLSPDVLLAALGEDELTPSVLDQIAATGACIVGWDERAMTVDAIAKLHARGWKAWAWTADDPARMANLIAIGIDAITSNVPAVLRQLVTNSQV